MEARKRQTVLAWTSSHKPSSPINLTRIFHLDRTSKKSTLIEVRFFTHYNFRRRFRYDDFKNRCAEAIVPSLKESLRQHDVGPTQRESLCLGLVAFARPLHTSTNAGRTVFSRRSVSSNRDRFEEGWSRPFRLLRDISDLAEQLRRRLRATPSCRSTPRAVGLCPRFESQLEFFFWRRDDDAATRNFGVLEKSCACRCRL